jgi:hypothetical protein
MLKGKVQQQQTSMCCSYNTDFKFMAIENAVETNNHTVAQKFCVVEQNVCCWRKQKKSVFKGRKLNLKSIRWALIGKF